MQYLCSASHPLSVWRPVHDSRKEDAQCEVWAVQCPRWAVVQSTELQAVIPDHGSRNTCRGGGRGALTPPWQGKGMGESSQASYQVTEASAPEEKLQTCCGLLCPGVICCRRVGATVQSTPSLWVCSVEAAWMWDAVPENGLAPAAVGTPLIPPGLCSATNLRDLWRWTSKVHFAGEKCCNNDLFTF